MKEYNEALCVKDISPKSCALMCRRITERVLVEHCGCNKYNLAEKLKEFKDKYAPTNYLVKSIEYIIVAGNAAAHNKKNFDDALIKLSKNDCAALLESIIELFEEVFVKPKKANLNQKKWQKVQPKK